MEKITKDKARTIMADLELAAAHVLEKHGMVVGKVSSKYGDGFQFTVTANKPEMNDSGVDSNNTDAQAFLNYAWEYGITDAKAALGATFTQGGKDFQLTGMNLRAKKFPFMVREVSTGKNFKSPAHIASLLPSYAAEKNMQSMLNR